MLFTIAIPTYNKAATLSFAVDSALNQNYNKEYEVLIVDNASSDDTNELLQTYTKNFSKIRVIRNPETVDLFANHNICFKEAKGNYILFCHSDDVLFSNALMVLEKVLAYRDYPQNYIMWGRSLYRDYFDNWTKGGCALNTILSGINGIRAFAMGGLTPSGTCYSHSISEIGGFGEMKSKLTPSDWTIMIKACLSGFEFEMIDRLYFKREYASTAHSFSTNELIKSIGEAFGILLTDLSEEQRLLVCNNMQIYGISEIYPAIKKYLTIKQRIDWLIKRILKSPFSIFLTLKIFFLSKE